ncbi:MAG: hypothetical protein ACR2OR_17555 [Hyphomicrobiales bacterium]
MPIISKRRRQSLVFVCWAALAVIFAAPALTESPPSRIHPKAQELIDGLKALRDVQDDAGKRTLEDKLWAAYMRSSYTGALNRTQQALYDAALKAKDCSQVERMQSVAFKRTFPFLAPVLQSDWAYESFRIQIIYGIPEVRYCSNRQNLDRILRLIKAHKLDILPFDYSDPANEQYLPYLLRTDEKPWLDKNAKLIDRARNSLCWRIHLLFNSAAKDGLTYALRDILQLAERRNEFRFSPAQLYAIHLRGQYAGILRDQEEKRLKHLYYQVKPKVRSKIDVRLKRDRSTPHSLSIPAQRCRSPKLTVLERFGLE